MDKGMEQHLLQMLDHLLARQTEEMKTGQEKIKARQDQLNQNAKCHMEAHL
jgi:hypothetical protein